MQYVRSAFGKGRGVNTPGVHGYKGALHLIGGINAAYLAVAGVLHGVEPVATQKLNDKGVKIFRACADNYLLRAHPHSAKGVKMPCDGLPQLHYACRGGSDHKLFRWN